MKFPNERRRNMFLVTLHLFGLLRLPDISKKSWIDSPFIVVIRYTLLSNLLLVGFLMMLSTFFESIHDTSEFIQRYLEFIVGSTCTAEAFHIGFRLKQVLQLFNLQESVFHVTNESIYRKYTRIENIELGILIFCDVLVIFVLMFETFLPVTERNTFLMASVYHKRYPFRLLPINIWTPNFIDINQKGWYICLYLLEINAVILMIVSIFGMLSMQIIFPTPLMGQYEMFIEFVEKIGTDHKNWYGETVFYTDVASGRYVTETQLLNLR